MVESYECRGRDRRFVDEPVPVCAADLELLLGCCRIPLVTERRKRSFDEEEVQ